MTSLDCKAIYFYFNRNQVNRKKTLASNWVEWFLPQLSITGECHRLDLRDTNSVMYLFVVFLCWLICLLFIYLSYKIDLISIFIYLSDAFINLSSIFSKSRWKWSKKFIFGLGWTFKIHFEITIKHWTINIASFIKFYIYYDFIGINLFYSKKERNSTQLIDKYYRIYFALQSVISEKYFRNDWSRALLLRAKI